jgi:hypothetical protein
MQNPREQSHPHRCPSRTLPVIQHTLLIERANAVKTWNARRAARVGPIVPVRLASMLPGRNWSAIVVLGGQVLLISVEMVGAKSTAATCTAGSSDRSQEVDAHVHKVAHLDSEREVRNSKRDSLTYAGYFFVLYFPSVLGNKSAILSLARDRCGFVLGRLIDPSFGHNAG